MAVNIAKAVSYPPEVYKKEETAHNSLLCHCAKSILQKSSSTQGQVCNPSNTHADNARASAAVHWGFFGTRGKRCLVPPEQEEVSPSPPSQGAVGSLLPLAGMGLLCTLQGFSVWLRSF